MNSFTLLLGMCKQAIRTPQYTQSEPTDVIISHTYISVLCVRPFSNDNTIQPCTFVLEGIAQNSSVSQPRPNVFGNLTRGKLKKTLTHVLYFTSLAIVLRHRNNGYTLCTCKIPVYKFH